MSSPFSCACGRAFRNAAGLGKHRRACAKGREALTASPVTLDQGTVEGWKRELREIDARRRDLYKRISAARLLGLVTSLALVLLTGCERLELLADRVFREPCARLCHDFASSTPIRPPTVEPVCRCADGSAWRFVGPGATERVLEDGSTEIAQPALR